MPPATRAVVAGAGPAGLECARILTEKDVAVTVLEEHDVIGRPEQCSGLISATGVHAHKIPVEGTVRNEIQGAKIFSPGGELLKIQKFETVAYVVDRHKLDEQYHALAQKAGVEVLLGTKLIDARGGKVFTQHSGGKGGMLKADVIVGADGATSRTRQIARMARPLTAYTNTYQVKAKGSFDREYVELYFGKKFAPNLFAWVIPESKTRAKLGLGTTTDQNAKRAFEKFVEEKQISVGDVVEEQAGFIPMGPPIREPVKDNLLLVGDAAYQTKSTTGGGIVTGVVAAKACANTIAAHLKEGKPLSEYAKRLAKLNSDLELHWKIRQYLNKMSDAEMDKMVSKMRKAKIDVFLEKHGNMDHPTFFIGKFVSNPRHWVLFPNIVKAVL